MNSIVLSKPQVLRVVNSENLIIISLTDKIGDNSHLWGKEAWASSRAGDGFRPGEIEGKPYPVWYLADEVVRIIWPGRHTSRRGKIRQARHMPEWASRIEFRADVKEVRRVQELDLKTMLGTGLQIPVSQEKHYILRFSGNNLRHPPVEYLRLGRLAPGQPSLTEEEIVRIEFASAWSQDNPKATWDTNPEVFVAWLTARVIRPQGNVPTGTPCSRPS